MGILFGLFDEDMDVLGIMRFYIEISSKGDGPTQLFYFQPFNPSFPQILGPNLRFLGPKKSWFITVMSPIVYFPQDSLKKNARLC